MRMQFVVVGGRLIPEFVERNPPLLSPVLQMRILNVVRLDQVGGSDVGDVAAEDASHAMVHDFMNS